MAIFAVILTALTVGARPAHAHHQQEMAAAALEQLARGEFGTLSAAEVQMLHAAPTREAVWTSPSQDVNAAVNDPAKARAWGPERAIRAAIIEWLVSDPQASKLVHPSGLGVKGARITGKLDLSYLTIGAPLMLAFCSIADGIDLQYARLQSLDFRGTWTGPIVGDQSLVAGNVISELRAL